GRQADLGPLERARGRALEIDPRDVVARAVARAFELVLRGQPVRRAAQVHAHGHQGIDRIGVPDDPDPVLLLPALVDTRGVARRLPGLESRRRLEENVGEEEADRRGQAHGGRRREARPSESHPLQSGTAGDPVEGDVLRRRRETIGGRRHQFLRIETTKRGSPLSRPFATFPRAAAAALRASARTRRLGSLWASLSIWGSVSVSFKRASALSALIIAASAWSLESAAWRASASRSIIDRRTGRPERSPSSASAMAAFHRTSAVLSSASTRRRGIALGSPSCPTT